MSTGNPSLLQLPKHTFSFLSIYAVILDKYNFLCFEVRAIEGDCEVVISLKHVVEG